MPYLKGNPNLLHILHSNAVYTVLKNHVPFILASSSLRSSEELATERIQTQKNRYLPISPVINEIFHRTQHETLSLNDWLVDFGLSMSSSNRAYQPKKTMSRLSLQFPLRSPAPRIYSNCRGEIEIASDITPKLKLARQISSIWKKWKWVETLQKTDSRWRKEAFLHPKQWKGKKKKVRKKIGWSVLACYSQVL